jgi:ribose-phosphate pyrophosphokinase
VDIIWPDIDAAGQTAVVVDDIVSSGETLLAVAQGLASRGFAHPICALTHALFDADTEVRLKRAFAKVVSTDTVPPFERHRHCASVHLIERKGEAARMRWNGAL